MPPPAEGFAARFVIGPALRTQPDRRLVTLVREGYENAFEEIVRRYGKLLTRYAAAIVGGRAEDVTQDAFSKALLALRRDGAEIELRPWLFRIVRNTALNDLRDSPPSAEALAEVIASGTGPAEELERREELADLMRRLQSLPEAQRAAIVMRELEGLSHEEIANALGLSDGGARQAIYRARRSLRDGAGMLLPLPLLKALLAGAAGSPAVEAGAGAAGVGVGGAAGAGVALKAAAATVLVAGAVGAGVAIDHNRHPHHSTSSQTGKVVADDLVTPGPSTGGDSSDAGGGRSGRSREPEPGDDRSGHGRDHSSGKSGDDRGRPSDDSGGDETSGSAGGHGSGQSGSGGHEEPGDDHGGGPGPSGHDGSDDGGGSHSGRSPGGSSGSGSGGSSAGGSSSGDGGGSSSSSGPGSGSSGGSSGSTSDSGSGSGGGSGSSGGSGSGGGPGPSGEDSGSGKESAESEPNFDDSGDSHSGSGFSVQMEPQTEEES